MKLNIALQWWKPISCFLVSSPKKTNRKDDQALYPVFDLELYGAVIFIL